MSTKRFIYFFNYLFYSFFHVFLSSRYLQKIFDNFGWFSVYIVAAVLMGFSEIDFTQVLILSFSFFFSFFIFFFSSTFSFFKTVFCFGGLLWVYFFLN